MTIADMPDPRDAVAEDLARVLREAGALADALAAEPGDRLAQYLQAAQLGEWLTAAADRLHYALDREINPDHQLPD
ncbi:hypothetical protein ACWGCC_37895 [Streptomyces nigrescens]